VKLESQLKDAHDRVIAGNHSLQTELADLRFQYEREKENSEL